MQMNGTDQKLSLDYGVRARPIALIQGSVVCSVSCTRLIPFYYDYFQDPGSPLDLSPNGNRVATVLIYVCRFRMSYFSLTLYCLLGVNDH